MGLMKHCAAIAALVAFATGAAAAEAPARAAFEQLASLAGDWRVAQEGSGTTANFRLTAAGSTVVETWDMGPGRESMTLYTMDGDSLLATHYCPQGNAPRLRYTHTDEHGAHRFLFVDGTNLQDGSRSHVHAFWLRLGDDGRLYRGETYIANGARHDPEAGGEQRIAFERITR